MIPKIFATFLFIVFPIIIVGGAIIVLFRLFVLPAVSNSGEKKNLVTITTKVVNKREHIAGSGHGCVTFYYVMFEDSLELDVPKKIYNKVNPNDLVKLTYIGEKFEEIKIIKASGEKSVPNYSIS